MITDSDPLGLRVSHYWFERLGSQEVFPSVHTVGMHADRTSGNRNV